MTAFFNTKKVINNSRSSCYVMKLVKINFKIAVVPHVRTCMSQLVVSAFTHGEYALNSKSTLPDESINKTVN